MINFQKISTKKLELTSFGLLFLYPQLNYHFGVLTTILIPISIILLFLTGIKNIRDRDTLALSPILLFSTLFFVLSLLLYIFGLPGKLNPRPLYLFSVLQIITIYNLIKIKNDTTCIRYFFLLSLAIELITVIGQFSFVSFGIGFETKHELDFTGIGGTLLNPNNSSIHILCTYIAYSHLSENIKNKAFNLIITLLTLAGILITLSRTVLILFIIHSIFFNKNSSNRTGFGRILTLAILPVIITIAYNTNVLNESDIGSRAIDRIESIQYLANDDSTSFRIDSFIALSNNLFNLGLGSFSDLNYQAYFDSNADSLIKTNPHSFITESSFLFGYPGLLYAIGLLGSIIHVVLTNKCYSFGVKIFISTTMVIATSIPSSIMINYVFFLPFIGLAFKTNAN